jgi:hypothetical protein
MGVYYLRGEKNMKRLQLVLADEVFEMFKAQAEKKGFSLSAYATYLVHEKDKEAENIALFCDLLKGTMNNEQKH